MGRVRFAAVAIGAEREGGWGVVVVLTVVVVLELVVAREGRPVAIVEERGRSVFDFEGAAAGASRRGLDATGSSAEGSRAGFVGLETRVCPWGAAGGAGGWGDGGRAVLFLLFAVEVIFRAGSDSSTGSSSSSSRARPFPFPFDLSVLPSKSVSSSSSSPSSTFPMSDVTNSPLLLGSSSSPPAPTLSSSSIVGSRDVRGVSPSRAFDFAFLAGVARSLGGEATLRLGGETCG